MPPFVPAVLQALDAVRSVGGLLGLRVIQVIVRKRVWTGGRPGQAGAVKLDTDVELVNFLAVPGLNVLPGTASVTFGSKAVTFSVPVTLPDRAALVLGTYSPTAPHYYVVGETNGTTATLSRPWVGATASGLAVTTDGQGYAVLVRQVSRRDIVSSGGLYRDGDLKVGPMTPTYLAGIFGPPGGQDDSEMDPAPTGFQTEIQWILAAPTGTFGIPASGLLFEKKGEEARAMHTYVILRSKGTAPT